MGGKRGKGANVFVEVRQDARCRLIVCVVFVFVLYAQLSRHILRSGLPEDRKYLRAVFQLGSYRKRVA